MGSRLLWLVLAGLLLRAQTVPPSATNPDAEKQAALEAQLAAEARRRTTAVSDPEILRYVKQVGTRLAAVMPQPSRQCDFVVIADDLNGSTHEPLSLPGGTIFVPLRLLADSRDEAEFAGMLAHAMSHVALYEPNRQNSSALGIPLIYTGANMSLGGEISGAVPLSLAQTMRARERSADFLAVQVIAETGYPPAALIRYIARTQSSDRPHPYATLPARDERVTALESAGRTRPIADAPESADFARIQKRVHALLPPPRPAPSLRGR